MKIYGFLHSIGLGITKKNFGFLSCFAILTGAVLLAICLALVPDVMTTWRNSGVSDHEVVLGQPFDAKDVPAGNYSGIVRLGGNRYALVSDKAEHGGYFIFNIDIDDDGNIVSVSNRGFRKLDDVNLDEEAIAYDKENHNIYIAKEETSEIVRYDILDGKKNGQVAVADYREKGLHNRTIESLTFDKRRLSVFTINEAPLAGDNGLMLRLMEFTPNLTLKKQHTYILDLPLDDSPITDEGHAFGVAELLSLGDGTLLVLEREFKVAGMKVGSWVINKIFRITPENPEKTFITGWRTVLGSSDSGLANYEGMCLGPKLPDGRQVIILCADSQDRHMGVLRDWFRTIVL